MQDWRSSTPGSTSQHGRHALGGLEYAIRTSRQPHDARACRTTTGTAVLAGRDLVRGSATSRKLHHGTPVGDPLQERSGRLEKMSFAAPWRTVDNMGLHGGRRARTVTSRRAPYLRPGPQCPRARTPNARSPRVPPRRVARGVDAPAPHHHAIGPGRRRTGGQALGATVTSLLTRTSPLSAARNLSEGLLGRFVI